MGYSIDFAAAKPGTYDPLIGGGTFNDGSSTTTVESLEGTDFTECDYVSYFLAISATDDVTPNSTLTIPLDFNVAGGDGVGYTSAVATVTNESDGSATASIASTTGSGDFTEDGKEFFDTINVAVNDVDPNETIIVRVDLKLEVDNDDFGGNFQAGIAGPVQVSDGSEFSAGAQIIPFKDVTSIEVEPPGEPSLAVDKRFIRYFDRDGSGDLSAGDRAVYRIFVTNNGEVDLDGVEVTDSLASGPLTLSDRAGDGVDVLAVGDTENARFVYTVTADDVAAGKIVNTGTADSNQTDPLSDMEMVGLPKPELEIDKFYKGFVDKDGNGLVTQGDILQFGITVSSTGTANLTDLSVVDELVGLDETIDLLEAGDSQTFHVTYKVTGEDALTGKVTNIAIGNSDQTGPEDDMEMVDVVIGANIDIKPGSFPSSFNLKGGGIVPVAIFGSEILDFGNDPIVEACLSEYAPGPAMGEGCTSNFNYEDINGDGYLDALAKFGKSSLRGVLDRDSTFAQLTGETQAGLDFVAVGDVNVVG